MRPPKGFENEKYPLRHRVIFSTGLGLKSDTQNTVFMPLVMSSTDMGTNPQPDTVIVNPHNTAFVEDTGPLVRQMSIIDRLTISLKFSMTHYCGPAHLASGTAGPNFDDGVYVGDDVPAFKFLWRPIFNVYPEKMDAADDDTGTTVAGILAMTKDATFEDIVAVTTNKLPTLGPAELPHPLSSVNDIQVFGDFNMTTNTAMEDHVFDESLLQTALRRYTNKGALRSCLGRTRHVTLTRAKPYMNFYIDKFVPNAIRRVQPYGLLGIQVHLPIDSQIGQLFMTKSTGTGIPHLGIKLIANYHEWNFEHDQSQLAT